jgi:hypothetical protein
MVVPNNVKALVPPIVTLPAPVSQIPPTAAVDESEGCKVYEAAENRPISPLPGTLPPPVVPLMLTQLEGSFQFVSGAVLLQLYVAHHVLELPQEIVPTSASPARAKQARRTATIGIACRRKSRDGDCRLRGTVAGSATSSIKVVFIDEL